jgi:pyruvate/2-oxoglutarate dehydrogenase complex dihydrolipoamide dehydrogenase (E3) component
VPNVEQYDALIIGAGQAGVPLARAFAQAGRRTALVEREHVGGTCINEGCTPTKTMVASARTAYVVSRASTYGVDLATSGPIDMTVVRHRKRAIVESFRNGSRRRLERQEHLDLIFSEAVFTGERQVAVGDRTLTAPIVVINAGARPAIPDLSGIDSVPYLTSTTIMELDIVPEHLVVLGGGYIGLEFAQMFRRFGSRVTVIQRSGHVLGREDADIVEEIEKILGDEGVEFLFNAEARNAERIGNDGVRLAVVVDGAERLIDGSHLLLAVGRKPNTDALQVERAGIEIDGRGFIKVDERLRTSANGVYALGDINGGPAFTHISYDDYRILEANLIKGGDRTTAGRLLPYTVFIDPELGRVGMTEIEAKSTGRNIKVAKMPMTHVARALETDEARGFMKAIVDADTEEILGCAVLGIEGGEIMGALQIAMMGGLRYTQLRDAVFAHPTLMESLNNLFMTLD